MLVVGKSREGRGRAVDWLCSHLVVEPGRELKNRLQHLLTICCRIPLMKQAKVLFWPDPSMGIGPQHTLTSFSRYLMSEMSSVMLLRQKTRT